MSSFRLAAAQVKQLRLINPSSILSSSTSLALNPPPPMPLKILPQAQLNSSSDDPLKSLFSLDDGEYIVKRTTIESILGASPTPQLSYPSTPLLSSSTTSTSQPTTTQPNDNPLAIPSSVLSSHSFPLHELLSSASAAPQLDLKTIKTPDIPKSENFNVMSKTDTVFFQACANCDIGALTGEVRSDELQI